MTCSELKLDGIDGSLWTGVVTVATGGEFVVAGGSVSITVVSSPQLGIVMARAGEARMGEGMVVIVMVW